MVRKLKKREKKEKYINYLRELITRTHKCLNAHNTYLEELKEYILKKSDGVLDCEQSNIFVDYLDYRRYLDLLSSPESYLLNLIGDSQAVSMSYKKFRDLIDKKIKKNKLDFELDALSEEEVFILSSLNKLRNWINHVPESLLTSEEKLISEGFFGRHSVNPIYINDFESCTLKFIEDLYEQSKHLNSGFKHIYNCMKRDYSKLIGQEIKIENRITHKPKGLEYLELGKFSAEVQGLH